MTKPQDRYLDLIKRVIVNTIYGGPNPYPVTPRMSPAEVALLTSVLRMTRHYFEFGMGGSTVLASRLASGKVYAVESEPTWIQKVRATIPLEEDRVHLIQADIGPTKEWGYPAELGTPEIYARYHTEPLATSGESIDTFFVDGRFRVACCCSIALIIRTDSVLLVHDYRSRPQYHIIESFFKPISEAEDLTCFVRRSEIDIEFITRLRKIYATKAE
ncbi:hypothetical protein [Bosea sp. BIWAKO-01]|uniref:hypothetical protein n=1 Tax=Bosea sp. BIWAKO-01 TaxID=506668 RepID=UPI00114D308C|nr:hypothetical protein [Bosea sp. BIWAKO-01]